MTTAPIRIEFSARGVPSLVAKAIRDHLSSRGMRLPLSMARDVVGRMFGYAGWGELVRSTGGCDSPADHLVAPEERRARLRQYHAALTAAGVPRELASETLATVAPTSGGLFRHEISDFLSHVPGRYSVLRGGDAIAFGASPGGRRLIDAIHAVVRDDAHWVVRGACRLHCPSDAWLGEALSSLRDDPTHPGWPSLAAVSLAQVVEVIGADHPHAAGTGIALRAAFSTGDLAGAATVLESASDAALLSLVSHVEDVLSAQVARLSPNRELFDTVVLTIPPVRTPWRAATPFDLRIAPGEPVLWSRDDAELLGLSYGDDAPENVLVTVRDRTDGPEWSFLAGDHAGFIAPARGPGERDDVVMVSAEDGTLLCAAVLRNRTDAAHGVHRIDVDGPHHMVDVGRGPPRADLEAFVQAVAVRRFEADLHAWGRVVPPGGRLELRVSNSCPVSGPRTHREIARLAGDRYESMQDNLMDLGYDLVVHLADAAGTPVALPALHAVAVPESVEGGWSDVVSAFVDLNEFGMGCLLACVAPAYALADAAMNALQDAEGIDAQYDVLTSQACEAAVRAVIMEAGLGPDAVLVLRPDFVAVVSRESLTNRDWTWGFGACLVVSQPLSEGSAQRLLHRFWHGFPSELDGVLDARAFRSPHGGFAHQGSGRAQ